MKITLNQLKKIIKEEIENVDSVSSNDEYMSVDDLIEFARAYVAVPRELRKTLDLILAGRGEGVTLEDVEDLKRLLSGYHKELDEFLDEALDSAQRYYNDEEDDGSWKSALKANM